MCISAGQRGAARLQRHKYFFVVMNSKFLTFIVIIYHVHIQHLEVSCDTDCMYKGTLHRPVLIVGAREEARG